MSEIDPPPVAQPDSEPARHTVKGLPPMVGMRHAPTPQPVPPGEQAADHWVLSEEDRAQGRIRPVRLEYKHVGRPAPRFELRDLTDEERERYPPDVTGYVKFEPYPETERPTTGRFWTQAELDSIGKGCGTVTRMPAACAETYAKAPGYYGGTYCCACREYLPVGAAGQFVWLDDGSRVGT